MFRTVKIRPCPATRIIDSRIFLQNMINEKKIGELKKELKEREAELLEEIKKLETPANYGHESEGNEDLSEEADETEEDEANMGIAEVFKKELEDVREELERIEKGEYRKK